MNQPLTNIKDEIDILKKELYEIKDIKIPRIINGMKIFMWLITTLFIGVLFAIVTGCSGGGSAGGSSPASTSKESSISGWQIREKQFVSTLSYNNINPTGSLYEDVEYLIRTLPSIKYTPDDATNYWQTSNETLQRREGDCEDMAILAYIAIYNSNLLDYYDLEIFVRWIDYGGDIGGHALCVIRSADGQLVSISDMAVFDGILDSTVQIVADFDLYSTFWGGVRL